MADALEQTLRAAGKGDGEAWRTLVQTYSGRVYALLYRQCGSAELAEEITQSAFVKVVSELPHYREIGRFEAWLFRIAVNRLRDELRRQKRQARATDMTAMAIETTGRSDQQPMPIERLEQQERENALIAAVNRLPEADRELLNLRYTAEMSFAQIAETLQEPLGTVLARGHRALKKLRRMLETDDDHAHADPSPAKSGEPPPSRDSAAGTG